MTQTVCLPLILMFIAVTAGCSSIQRISPTTVIETGHTSGYVVAFNDTGNLLAFGGKGGSIRLYATANPVRRTGWRSHANQTVTGVAFDDDALLTAGYDGRLIRWTLQGQQLSEMRSPSPITALELDAQRARIVTGHQDGRIRLWNKDHLSIEAVLDPHSATITGLAVHAASGRIASSDNERGVYLHGEDGSIQLAAPPLTTYSLTFSTDGKTLFGGGWFKLFRWDLDNGELTVLDTPHHGLIKDLHWVESGNQIASISRITDSSVVFLDPATGRGVRYFQKHELCGASVALSPGGRYLATTSDDASVRLWDLQSQ